MTLKQHWHAMLDLLGLAPSETSLTPTSDNSPDNTPSNTAAPVPEAKQTPSQSEPSPAQNYQQEIVSLKAQIASLEAENARLKAYPTQTLAREDPSPVERKISANAHSYNEDIRNFK